MRLEDRFKSMDIQMLTGLVVSQIGDLLVDSCFHLEVLLAGNKK